MSKWGAAVAGSVLLILGAALLRAGLVMPDGELPLMGLVRIVTEWLVGLVLLIGGGLTLVAGIWTAVHPRRRVTDGLDRDLRISAGWPTSNDW